MGNVFERLPSLVQGCGDVELVSERFLERRRVRGRLVVSEKVQEQREVL